MTELALLLAMTCVAEISLQKDPTECVLMWQINQETAERRGVTLQDQTLAFNAYWDPRSKDNRHWIAELDEDGTRPPSWPGESVSWRIHRVRWLRYLKAAERFLVAPGKHQCPRAKDYGGAIDGRHADDHPPRKCYRREKCLNGQTLQWYWN
ncbi:MAG: hypothetical protein ACYTBJ_24860, partial [Planctomycetota bacterium]